MASDMTNRTRQFDGYAGDHKTYAIFVGCFEPARRTFIEAQKMQIKGKAGKADWAVNHFQKLYGIEKAIKGQPAADKQLARQQQAKPLLGGRGWIHPSIKCRLNPPSAKPSGTAYGKAIKYSLRQWPKRIRYIGSGDLNIDSHGMLI